MGQILWVGGVSLWKG